MARDGKSAPASKVVDGIRQIPYVRREATLASIHFGRLMVTTSLPAFVAIHI
jgi:hypothetical protein